MKICDILTEAPLDFTTNPKIRAMAAKHGYKLLGSGNDASVFGSRRHRPKTVVKITSGIMDVSAKEASQGFDWFYKFCRQHPNHPNLPKFIDKGFFTINKEKIPYVRMERLRNRPQARYILRVVYDIVEEAFNDQMFSWDTIGMEISSRYKKLSPQQLEIFKEFYAILRELKAFYLKNSSMLNWDLHENNVMYRGNVPVITDPFTGQEVFKESWSKDYKKSIDCSEPKGFSQRAHCAGRKARKAGKKTKSASVSENFADGKKPGRKGLAKRSGVDCKQSVSKLRTVAKNSTGEKQRMAHWCSNMKSGKKK